MYVYSRKHSAKDKRVGGANACTVPSLVACLLRLAFQSSMNHKQAQAFALSRLVHAGVKGNSRRLGDHVSVVAALYGVVVPNGHCIDCTRSITVFINRFTVLPSMARRGHALVAAGPGDPYHNTQGDKDLPRSAVWTGPFASRSLLHRS